MSENGRQLPNRYTPLITENSKYNLGDARNYKCI